MTDLERLLPCPFCGKTETVRVISSFDLMDEDEQDHGHPECWAGNCDGSREGAKVAGGCGATSGYAFSKEEAAAHWNRRSPAPPAGEAKDTPAVPDTLPEYPVLVEIEGGTLNQKLTLYYVYKSDYDALRQHAARLQGELAEAQVQAACWRKFVSLQTGDVTQLCHRAERAEAAERTVGELREHVRRMGDSATDMFEQMLRGKWVDDHGHDVRMNKAMAELCEAVKLATPAARET